MAEPGEKKGISGQFITDLSKGGMDPETPLIEIEKLGEAGLSQGVENLPSQEEKSKKETK